MIPVIPQMEPDDFDKLVRQPGLESLARIASKKATQAAMASNKHGAVEEPELPPHWRACLKHLHRTYRGICAYLCIHIPPAVGNRTTDHFISKSPRKELAYEWSNYRLACGLMNSRKRAYDDVLDPFDIGWDWFVLELSFLQVLPNPQYDLRIQDHVWDTIERLDLNDSECIEAREYHYRAYLNKGLTYCQLCEWSPFVAYELFRQGQLEF